MDGVIVFLYISGFIYHKMVFSHVLWIGPLSWTTVLGCSATSGFKSLFPIPNAEKQRAFLDRSMQHI